MNGLRKSIACVFVLLIGIVVITTSALAERDFSLYQQELQPTPRTPIEIPSQDVISIEKVVDPTDLPFIESAAGTYGLSAENLQVEYKEQIVLPLTEQSFSFAKVIDVSTGEVFGIALNADGSIVDSEALRAAEKDTYYSTFGKLHPSLANYLLSRSPADMIRVSIWLDMDGHDASIARLSPEEAASMSNEEINQLKAQNRVHASLVHQEIEQPLLDLLPSLGGQVIDAANTAPLVFAEIPVSAIPQLEALPYVVTIDLLVEGGPEENADVEEKPNGGPEMDTAQPTSKANIVAARGITGSGIIAAVVEGDSAEFNNPYIDGTCGPNAACPTIDEHPTAVSGILASTHSTNRGTAPGIGSGLRSANGGGWTLAQHQAATTWALNQNANIFNNSYLLETDGVMHNSDRWMDYIVRNSWVLEVKSAGNRGEGDAYVTSPGLGYNVLTVGAIEDKNTITWDDDTMAEFSSYNEPGGRDKPDVSAVGCGEWVTGTGGSPGIISTGRYTPWIYDQGCGTSYAAPIAAGGGALLLQRNSGLAGWPETQKAILIATALHNIEGASARSEIDGAGAVDLAAADIVAANGWWNSLNITPGIFDASNNYTARAIYLYAGERVRLSLAYDSNPSADYTSDPLEGDLDLYLLNPSGTVVASSSGFDSWEIIDYTTTVDGNYTVRIHNFGGSLSGSELTYAGLAIWPGHYVLAPYTSQTRDRPPGAWNQDSGDDYRFTRGSYWNAVGIQSTPADYDIFLFNNSVYGDPADHARLEDSTLTSLLDFVVVDGNHAPSGNYYATVSAFSGTGSYSIQHATRTIDLMYGTFGPYPIAPTDIVRVWDALLVGLERKYFAMKPVSGDANLGMALFDTDPGTSTSFYQGRSQAVIEADSAGAGGSESMNYQTSTSDFLGFVVWNNGATSSTNFYLYVDTTAPSGSIAINAGASYVNSTSVILNLSASDPETSVYQMRFSNDGSTWSGWEAYAASKAWTIPGGDGTKTVYVQYMNNAEMSSSSISDTIILDTSPPSSSAFSPATSTAHFFLVTWSGMDNLSGITYYDIEYKVGSGGVWTSWIAATSATSAVFGPTNPVVVTVGQTYYFRVRANDQAGNSEIFPGGNGDTGTTIIFFTVFLPLATK